MTFSRQLGLVLIIAVVACGCSRNTAPPEDQGENKPAPPKPKTRVTQKDAAAIGQRLCEAARAGDQATLDELLDWERTIDRTLAGLQITEENARSARIGLRKGKQQVIDSFVQVCANGGDLHCLRAVEVDGAWRARVRIRLPSDSVDYRDFVVGKDDGGAARIIDMFIFRDGALFSKKTKRQIAPVLEKGGAAQTEAADAIKRLDLMRDAEPEQALRLYEMLPYAIQIERETQVLRIQALLQLDYDRFAKAVQDYRKKYPDDPSAELIAFQYHAMQDDYAPAADALQRADKAIGGDPFLKFLQATMLYFNDETEPVYELCDKVVAVEPEIADAFWLPLTTAIEDGDHPRAREWLVRVGDHHEIDWDSLATIDGFDAFHETIKGVEGVPQAP